MSGLNFKKEARAAKQKEKRKLKRQKHAARKQAADKDIPEPGATEPISLLQNQEGAAFSE